MTPFEFLAAFFPAEREPINLRFFKPHGAPDRPDNKPVKLTVSRAQIASDKNTQEKLRQYNMTRGVYFVVNTGGDKDEDITRYNACFAESDTATIEEQHAALDAAPIQPSIRVETKKSVHAYWLLTGDCTESEWRDAQARLIAFFGGDEKIKNPSRVMRLPGFDHLAADGAKKRVECGAFEPERRYDIADLLAAFSLTAPQPTRPRTRTGRGTFATWDALRAELGRLIMADSSARLNSGSKWDCRAHCHNGKGNSGLFYDPATNQAYCNASCDQAAILRAFGLPEQPEGSKVRPHVNCATSMPNEDNSELEEWETPTPFYEFNLPEFPTETLPAWLKSFVEGLAVATQTPVDLCAMLALAALAASVARKVRITAAHGWVEPTNLYVAVALPPGNRKSAVMEQIRRPLEDFERELIEAARNEITEQINERKVLEARWDRAVKDCAKLEGNELAKRKDEAKQLKQELDALKIPALPQLIADDITSEELATKLEEQKGRLALFSAEGGIFEVMAGRYSSGSANIDVYLKSHPGDMLRINRRDRAEYIEAPALTLGLAVQPDVIRGLADKPGFRGRGLVGRFLFALPHSNLGSRKIRATPLTDEAKDTYTRNIKELARVQPYGDNPDQARMLRLTKDADDYLAAFEEELESQLGAYGELGAMSDWAGKLAGEIVRIAALFHLAEHVHQVNTGNWPEVVGAETLKRAIIVGRYLIPHAKAAYAEMGADPKIEDAKHLVRWLERDGRATVTKRDIFEGTKGRFKEVSALEPALAILEEHGYLRLIDQPERAGRGRKPSQQYAVNPFLTSGSQNSHNSQNSPQKSISANSANSANDASASILTDQERALIQDHERDLPKLPTFAELYAGTDDAGRYALDERAAVYEFEAGLTLAEAEQRAVTEYLKCQGRSAVNHASLSPQDSH